MVRISDARMSNTAFGTIMLHISPEDDAGRPLTEVQSGDQIRLSIKEKKIELLLSDEEIAKRLKNHRKLKTLTRL